MNWRSIGLVESRLQGFSWDAPNASQVMLKAVEEYAVECSIVKVHSSETLGYVTDEGVQIHGGYGYHQDYAVERAYRDSRINRIFEGTNEINRLLIPGMLLKRAARGQFSFAAAAEALRESAAGDEESRLVSNAKKIALLCMAAASQKFGKELDKQQEVLMNIADIIVEAYAMESSLLRARKLSAAGKQTHASELATVLLRDAMGRADLSARNALAAVGDADALQMLRKLVRYEPIDAIAARRSIAARLLQAEKYVV